MGPELEQVGIKRGPGAGAAPRTVGVELPVPPAEATVAGPDVGTGQFGQQRDKPGVLGKVAAPEGDPPQPPERQTWGVGDQIGAAQPAPTDLDRSATAVSHQMQGVQGVPLAPSGLQGSRDQRQGITVQPQEQLRPQADRQQFADPRAKAIGDKQLLSPPGRRAQRTGQSADGDGGDRQGRTGRAGQRQGKTETTSGGRPQPLQECLRIMPANPQAVQPPIPVGRRSHVHRTICRNDCR